MDRGRYLPWMGGVPTLDVGYTYSGQGVPTLDGGISTLDRGGPSLDRGYQRYLHQLEGGTPCQLEGKYPQGWKLGTPLIGKKIATSPQVNGVYLPVNRHSQV